MDNTANLALPYILPSQAQKHVTHNEALRQLDAVVQLSCQSRAVATPPSTPAEGERYCVPQGADGAWEGKAGRIAIFQDGAWAFVLPRTGWVAYVADEAALLVHDGEGFIDVAPPVPDSFAVLGVNATADAINKLAVASSASLFNHDGAGHQLKLNKAAAAQTASLLMQTDFSGRAEMGLTGDDSFRIKVSGDGQLWHEAMVVNPASGAVSFPNTTIAGASGTPGGATSQVQFNNAGTFGGDASHTFNAATKVVGAAAVNLPATTGINAGVLQMGGARFAHAFGVNNLFFGAGAGNFTMTSNNNVGIGATALQSLTSGASNLAVGYAALGNLTTGGGNAVFGNNAGSLLTTQSDNVMIGPGAGQLCTGNSNVLTGGYAGLAVSGSNNACYGTAAGQNMTTAAFSAVFGRMAGLELTTGSNNAFFGSGAGRGITTGSNNLVLGGVTGLAATLTNTIVIGTGGGATRLTIDSNAVASFTGSINIPATTGLNAGVLQMNGARFAHAFGTNSLFYGTNAGNFTASGNSNLGLGGSALSALTTGGNNIGIGFRSLWNVTTGSNNIAIGPAGGAPITTQTGNTLVGSNNGASTASNDNSYFGSSIGGGAGGFNSIFGASAGSVMTTAQFASLFGRMAGADLTTGSNNAFFGHQAGRGITTGSGNTVLGGVTGLAATLTNTVVIGTGGGVVRQTIDSNGHAAFEGVVRPKSYMVATLPAAALAGAGAMAFVSNESGGAVPAFSDGAAWRRVTDRAVVS